jgi:MoaA/NifB/PqqE/SkfB family radical SAM enzyme
MHENTCPAMFLDATIDPAGAYSPCTALGGGAFKFNTTSFKSNWIDPQLEDARQRSLAGEKLDMCTRCWSEESLGFKSERLYAKEAANNAYTQSYKLGPIHLNIKVSNICNLRCRTCQSKDSYLYHIEGAYYEQKNNITGTPYTLEKYKKHFTDQQLDELFEISSRLERIELYGGEPLLDLQVPKYLLRLVKAGMAKNISLKVSTNATHELTDTWRQIFAGFKSVVLNVSIDAIGNQFTYVRHPGDWTVAERNLLSFMELDVQVIPVVTVSALNVWAVPVVFDYFKQYNVEPYIILVQWPTYYCVNIFPDVIKTVVEKHLMLYNNDKFNPIINLMNMQPKQSSRRSTLTPWEEFKFWTKEKDAYRKENFIKTFDEIGKVIVDCNEWD